MSRIDYKSAGVNIDAGNAAVNLIKDKVNATYSSYVLSQIGGFAAMLDLKALTEGYEHPVLVQSIDGLGTKPIIARMMQRYDTLGIDLLSATANDILVTGAKPIALLDYIANDRLDPNMIDEFITGLTQACLDNDVSLIGGETAEMPDVYLSGEHDFVGIVSGIVDKNKIIDGRRVEVGDKILGFASNGFHTNGYSLVRKVFFSKGYDVDSYIPDFNDTLGEILLSPHLNYTRPIMASLKADIDIKGMAHITGGGLLENIPRVLPQNCAVNLDQSTWEVLPEFTMLQALAQLEDHEMYRSCNMGIGYICILDEENAERMLKDLAHFNDYNIAMIGEVVSGDRSINIIK